jgi:hypothetical protein
MDQAPDADAAMADGRMPTASPAVLQRIGRIAFILGGLLVVASLFVPWLDVTGDDYGHSPVWIHYNYGPLYLIHWEIPGNGYWLLASPLLVALACVLGIFVCAFMLLSRHGRKRRGTPLFFLVICGGAAFFVTLVGVLQAVPFWLSFGYPSYGSTPDLGVWLELAGIVVVFLGSAIAWPDGK